MRVLEGEPLTLEWTFNVTKTVLRVELRDNDPDNREALVETYPLLNIEPIIRGIFVGRISVSITATNATIILSSSNRIDTGTYFFTVAGISGGTVEKRLQIIVQCKYKPWHASVIIKASHWKHTPYFSFNRNQFEI